MPVGSASGKVPETARKKSAGCKVACVDGIKNEVVEVVSGTAPVAALVGPGVSAL